MKGVRHETQRWELKSSYYCVHRIFSGTWCRPAVCGRPVWYFTTMIAMFSQGFVPFRHPLTPKLNCASSDQLVKPPCERNLQRKLQTSVPDQLSSLSPHPAHTSHWFDDAVCLIIYSCVGRIYICPDSIAEQCVIFTNRMTVQHVQKVEDCAV